MEVFVIYIRIESSSAVPIYRQIADQIKYQIALGTLRVKQKMPSVRELAHQLAVNQNTILKVYNQLCQEKILQVDRGTGTFVAVGQQTIPISQRRQIVTKILGEAAVQAIHLGVEIREVHDLLDREYQSIKQQQLRSKQDE
ncbi:MAG: GntR family transcriptional regulator [Phycisphaerae bacterium]